MGLILKEPVDKEFQEIVEYIHVFDLDNRDLQQKQFIAAFLNNQLVGFARLREHAGFMELCSLGVVTSYRRKGVGKAIVEELIKSSKKNIYLVCIIPDYFNPFGFNIVNEFPISMQHKIDYCTKHLVVPQNYLVMFMDKQLP